MKSYIKSVDTIMMSPLVGYDKYKEYHERIENEIIGIIAVDGTIIKSQSKHFLERVFGTISDPTHEGFKRSDAELDNVKNCIKNGKYIPPKNPANTTSVVLATDKWTCQEMCSHFLPKISIVSIKPQFAATNTSPYKPPAAAHQG